MYEQYRTNLKSRTDKICELLGKTGNKYYVDEYLLAFVDKVTVAARTNIVDHLPAFRL